MTSLPDDFVAPPINFTWFVPDKICASGWPKNPANVHFLKGIGVKHIVTLSSDMVPPKVENSITHHLIPVEEFEPPTIPQIEEFINICQEAHSKKEPICVHCRQGLGRTGVMLGCYLVKFDGMVPDAAIHSVRMRRWCYSIETWEQERVIKEYWNYLGSR